MEAPLSDETYFGNSLASANQNIRRMARYPTGRRHGNSSGIHPGATGSRFKSTANAGASAGRLRRRLRVRGSDQYDTLGLDGGVGGVIGATSGIGSLSFNGAEFLYLSLGSGRQQEIKSSIETTSTAITQSVTVTSIHDPIGGASGSPLRSGITAKSIAAYHVVIGG